MSKLTDDELRKLASEIRLFDRTATGACSCAPHTFTEIASAIDGLLDEKAAQRKMLEQAGADEAEWDKEASDLRAKVAELEKRIAAAYTLLTKVANVMESIEGYEGTELVRIRQWLAAAKHE